MSVDMPQPTSAQTPSDRHMLLEAAVGLIERRIGAIRSGTAPLHVVLELESAARAIRTLATEFDRLHERCGASDERRHPASALRGPPVLHRVSRDDG